MKISEAESFKFRENLLGSNGLGDWQEPTMTAELTKQKTSWGMIATIEKLIMIASIL